MAPLPTLTDRPVTACGLRRLATAVLKTIHGDPWDAGMVNQRARQLEKWAESTGYYDPAPGAVVDFPYGALFAANNEGNLTPVDLIKAWINGDGPQGAGTTPSITETVHRIVGLLDPESEHLATLRQLKAHSGQQSKERSQAAAAAAPPYETFLCNNTVALWAEGMRADATLDQVSHMVFCNIEIALTGSRGKAVAHRDTP